MKKSLTSILCSLLSTALFANISPVDIHLIATAYVSTNADSVEWKRSEPFVLSTFDIHGDSLPVLPFTGLYTRPGPAFFKLNYVTNYNGPGNYQTLIYNIKWGWNVKMITNQLYQLSFWVFPWYGLYANTQYKVELTITNETPPLTAFESTNLLDTNIDDPLPMPIGDTNQL